MKFLSLISIQDEYDSVIDINSKMVHFASTDVLQVTKELRSKFKDNSLYLVIRLVPELLNPPKIQYKPNTNVPTDESKQQIQSYLENTYIDLPIQLQECLILGIGSKAHSMGFLSNDPRTGTASVVNPYLERYELSIKKAKENGFVHQTTLEHRTISTKGFI